jgi:hypothetical protein
VAGAEQHAGLEEIVDVWFAAWSEKDPAAQTHVPGVSLAREGAPRHCQGMALVDWIARSPDGTPVARGTNVFELAPDGRIARVVGFWSAG